MCLFVFNSIQKVKIILLIFTVFSRFSTGIILVSVETLYDRFLLPCFLKHDEVQFSLNHQSFLPPTGQLCPKAFADFKGSSSSFDRKNRSFSLLCSILGQFSLQIFYPPQTYARESGSH